VKSYVSIAAAVTAYARVYTIQYKTLSQIIFYNTNIYSMFVDKELPPNLVGNDLRQMTDELDREFINKAYFLGIKKYGYIDNNDITHSVFSGIERNSLNRNEIEQISKGFTIIKPSPIRFYKNHFRFKH